MGALACTHILQAPVKLQNFISIEQPYAVCLHSSFQLFKFLQQLVPAR